MTKLTSLKGAENLPQPIKAPYNMIQDTYNIPINDLEQCGIVLDEKLLRDIICSEYYPSDERATLLAQQLASQPEKFITIVRK